MQSTSKTSSQRQEAAGQPIHAEVLQWLSNSLSAFPVPVKISVNFWGAQKFNCDQKRLSQSRRLTIDVHQPGVIRELLLTGDPLVLVEFLIDGQISFTGTIDDAVSLYCYLASKQIKPSESLLAWCKELSETKLRTPDSKTSALSRASSGAEGWQNLPTDSRQRNKAVIQYHYDVSNDFYKLWLDPLMLYSCAHFEQPEMTLADAQKAKLDLICRKLKLKPGEKFLDVGCGWGALLHWAVANYGVSAHGITLSEEQLAHNLQWIEEKGLQDKVKVELLDYRDLPKEPAFDKIASVGMIEHVGIANYQTYYRSVLAALKPGGLFLNHGIALNRLWQPEVAFVLRYIFPDAQCPPVNTYLQFAVNEGWEIVDLDSWRPHYAKTLRAWAANLEANLEQAISIVGNRIKVWQLYLAMCAQGFENGSSGVYQMLLRRAADSDWNLPLTREGWLC